MARRRKGRKISGWIVLDKPAGLTSTTVVNKVRRAFDAQKAGHAGTLDPAATGLLAIALGEATKTVPYVTDALKAYEFTIRLGIATNTDDQEGEIIDTSDIRPTNGEIESALAQFRGNIMQTPPAFSAVKVDGVRAYAKAREGEDVTLEARAQWVESLTLDERLDEDRLRLTMTCAKGGYVRAIARDLGQDLGCFGHVETLRRVWSGPFDLSDAVTLESIEARTGSPEIDALLRPVAEGLANLPHAPTTAEGAARLRNGNPGMVIASDIEFGEEMWTSHMGVPIAVGRYLSGELHPSRVFNL